MSWLVILLLCIIGVCVYLAISILILPWIQEQLELLNPRPNPVYHDEGTLGEILGEAGKGFCMSCIWPIMVIFICYRYFYLGLLDGKT